MASRSPGPAAQRGRLHHPTQGREETTYLVLWWLDKTPYVARFEDEEEADRAARIRNSLMVEVRGHRLSIPRVVDYYRRDDDGHPMPARWQDLSGRGKPRVQFGSLMAV